jgi:hypothetical protein
MYLDALYSDWGGRFFPFRLRSDSGLPGRHFIGGCAPHHVVPLRKASATFFLGVLGLTVDQDVGIFCHVDYESSTSPTYFYTASHRLWDDSADYLEFVVFDRGAEPSRSRPYPTQLPELRFSFYDGGNDLAAPTAADYAEGSIFSDHKIGGLPFFEQIEGRILDDVLKAREDGFAHILQLAFPGPEDTLIDADWPFGPMVFHVFARRSKATAAFEFRYGWG